MARACWRHRPLSAELIRQYAFIPARYSAAFLAAHNADPGGWVARAIPFVSYMALHNDVTHLAINSLWLLAFGPIVARRFGGALFLLFFLSLRSGGRICSSRLQLGLAGAGDRGLRRDLRADGGGPQAAAVAGALGHPGEERMAPIFSRQILMFTLVWMGINLAAGMTGLGMGGEVGLIAWQAHLGGYLAGLFLAGPFDRLRPRTDVI